MGKIQIRPLTVENRDGFEKYFVGRTQILEIGEVIGYDFEEESVTEDS